MFLSAGIDSHRLGRTAHSPLGEPGLTYFVSDETESSSLRSQPILGLLLYTQFSPQAQSLPLYPL
jgi:hypothetical protein